MIDTRFPLRFGPYTLLESLGRGGMAEVFLADYEAMPGTRRLVALKQVLPGLATDPTFVGMFLDEARVLSSLYHPNLDHVVDVGEVEEVPYLALDYIPGRDLLQVLHRQEARTALPAQLAVHIVSKVLAGLAHAHGRTNSDGRSLGIVHRDVSPENIILAFDGTVKLCDFGIARGEMRAVVTEPGFIKGKPSYMAPEQVLGQAIDLRADLFAVGVLLYRLVVGRHPFRVSGNDEETFRRIVQEAPAPPHLVRRGIDDGLSVVILRAMSKKADDRPESADALLALLEDVMAEHRWVGGERQLRERMQELFPTAAEAARRLATQPANLAAAREASHYLSDADIEVLDTPTGQKIPDLPPPRAASESKKRKKTKKRRDPSLDVADARLAREPAGLETVADEPTPTETHTASISEVDTLPGEIFDSVASLPAPPAAPARSGRLPRPLPDAADVRLRAPILDDEDPSDLYSDVSTHTALRPPGDDATARASVAELLSEAIDDEPTTPAGMRSLEGPRAAPSASGSPPPPPLASSDRHPAFPVFWLVGGFVVTGIVLVIATC